MPLCVAETGGEKMSSGKRLQGVMRSAKIHTMFTASHITVSFVLAVAAAAAHAGTAVSRLEAPPPAHADLESSAEMPVPQAFPSARNLKLTLSLDNASQTNNAEIEIGETILGWDCGEWFVLGDRQRVRLSAAGGGPGQRALAVRIQVTPSNTLSRVSFKADGYSVGFGGGPSPSPVKGWLAEQDGVVGWLDPGTFDIIRVTSRGGAQGVSATAGWHADGTVMILK
jgi:hypothetical protein